MASGTFFRTSSCETTLTPRRYPARISAVTGSQESPLYTITFKGYSSSTNVPLSSLKPHDPNAPIPQPQKRANEELSERDKEKKKKKGEKWMETQKAKAEEVKDKKQAWEKFGKKASKKGIHISGWVRSVSLSLVLMRVGWKGNRCSGRRIIRSVSLYSLSYVALTDAVP